MVLNCAVLALLLQMTFSLAVVVGEEKDSIRTNLEGIDSDIEDAVRSLNTMIKNYKDNIHTCEIELDYVRDQLLIEKEELKNQALNYQFDIMEKDIWLDSKDKIIKELESRVSKFEKQIIEIEKNKGYSYSFGKFKAGKPLKKEKFEELLGLVRTGATFKIGLVDGCADVKFSIFNVERVLNSVTGSVIWMYMKRETTTSENGYSTFGIQISKGGDDNDSNKIRNGNYWIGTPKEVKSFKDWNCGSNDNIVKIGEEWTDYEIFVKR